MPASTLDPIASTLKQAFQGIQAKAQGGSLKVESGLQASAKKSLLSVVHFDSPIRHLGSSALQGAAGLKYNLICLNGGKKGGGANGVKSGRSSSEARGDSGAETRAADAPAKPRIVYFPLESIEVGYHRQRSSGAGMSNMGNTCYLNSTLQALFHTPALFNYLMGDSHKRECSQKGSGGFLHTCMICVLANTLKDTLTVNVMRPNRVYDKLKNICKHLVHGRQEDAHEFLRYLIESLQKSFLVSRHAPKSIDNASKETTPFNQIFGGYMRQDVTCLKCKYVSITFQHFMDLLLDIRQASKIEEALNFYFRAERIGSGDGGNMYKCDKCNMKVPAKKRSFIERPPVVMCIQLKRFSLLGGKISRPVQLSRKIELNSFVKRKEVSVNPSPPLQYKLVAMITHVGPSPNCGHYTAIGEASSGQFFQFDDASVRPISINQALNTASYVVFYEMTAQTKKHWIDQANSEQNTMPTYTVSSIKESGFNKPCTATSATPSNGSWSSLTKATSSPVTSNGSKPRMIPANGVVNRIGVVHSKAESSPIAKQKPLGLVPYGPADSSDEAEEEDQESPAKHQQNSHKPATLTSNPFVPRSVTVNALKRSQEPRAGSPAMCMSNKTLNEMRKISEGVPNGVAKSNVTSSGSGKWQVTDADHHNPSISSDNSNGSTSGTWRITPTPTGTTTTTAVISLAHPTTPPDTPKGAEQPGSLELSEKDHQMRNYLPRQQPSILPKQTSITSSSTASSSLCSTPEHSRASKRSSSIEDYEAELDRGRTKKVKRRHEPNERASFNGDDNPFQTFQNGNQRPHSSHGPRSSTWAGAGKGGGYRDHRNGREGGGSQHLRRTFSSSSLYGDDHHRDGHKRRDDSNRRRPNNDHNGNGHWGSGQRGNGHSHNNHHSNRGHGGRDYGSNNQRHYSNHRR